MNGRLVGATALCILITGLAGCSSVDSHIAYYGINPLIESGRALQISDVVVQQLQKAGARSDQLVRASQLSFAAYDVQTEYAAALRGATSDRLRLETAVAKMRSVRSEFDKEFASQFQFTATAPD